MVDLRVDSVGIIELRRALGGASARIDAATRRAINRTLVTARLQTSKQLRADTPIPATILRDRLVITRATGKSLEGRLTATGRGIPLIHFKARQTARGVSYQVRGQGRTLASGFIQQTGQGRQVLRRARDPATGRLVGRLPAHIRYGPGVPTLFADVLPAIQIEAAQILTKNFRAEVDFAFSNRATTRA